MSALKDGGYTVTLKGKEYRLLFTLNALDEIQGKFGGYDKLNEVFNQNNPDWVKDTKWLLTLLLNEGLLEEDENAELLTETQVGRMIHTGNLQEVQRAILRVLCCRDSRRRRKGQRGRGGAGRGKRRYGGNGQPRRKIRHCAAFIYRYGAAGIPGARGVEKNTIPDCDAI